MMSALVKKYLLIFLLGLSILFAVDKVEIPPVVKSSIVKQYDGKEIQFLFIKNIGGTKYQVIIKIDDRKEKVIIDNKGKIFSISDYLNDIEPSGGC